VNTLPRTLKFGIVVTLASSLLAPAAALADPACDVATASKLRALERFADFVRIDKPGLARVYGQDGTELTAGEALWMKGQLRGADTACAHGDPAGAGRRLQAVEGLIQAHAPQNL
jgi:hypothetical protein